MEYNRNGRRVTTKDAKKISALSANPWRSLRLKKIK